MSPRTDAGLRPGADSTDDGIDLFVREHAARALGEGRHRGAGDAVGGGAANRGVVSDREEDGIAQGDRRSSLAVRGRDIPRSSARREC